MPKYNIHFYETLRVKIIEVEAASTKEAIEAAENRFPDQSHFQLERPGCFETELANERTSVLVDPLDDNGEVLYDHSFWYDWPGYVQRPWRAVVLLKKAHAELTGKPLSGDIFDFLKEIDGDKIKDLPHPSLEAQK